MKNLFHLNRRRRRGFSLVEVAIVLAVLGIILSGVVLPAGNALRQKGYDSTHDQIADAIDAVIGYGVTRHSPGMLVLHGGAADGVRGGTDGAADKIIKARSGFGLQYTRIPAGRPYLPCPDIDNDGKEDRRAIVNPRDNPVPQDINLDITTINGTTYGDLRVVHFDEQNMLVGGDNEGLPDFGECERQYGNLPWKTLGMSPGDAWGSLLTYIVHPNFSTAAFGFDQNTRAFPFQPYDTPDSTVYKTTTASRSQASGSSIGHGADAMAALFVCGLDTRTVNNNVNLFDSCEMEGGPVSGTRNLDIETLTDSLNYSRYIGIYAATRSHLYGGSAATQNTIVGRYQSPNAGLFTDGLPFAIISHGANRYNARRVSTGIDEDPSTGTPPTEAVACNRTRDGSIPNPDSVIKSSSELVNSSYGTCQPAANNALDATNSTHFGQNGIVNNYETSPDSPSLIYATGPISNGDLFRVVDIYGGIYAFTRGGRRSKDTLTTSIYQDPDFLGYHYFDDVVGWSTRRELVDQLYDAGIFPVAKYDGMLLEGMPAIQIGM